MKSYPSWMRRNLRWVRYETMSEFLRHLETLPRKGAMKFDTWYGGMGYTVDETFHLARYGWPEATRVASELAEKLTARIVSMSDLSVAPKIGYDVVGGAYDPGAYIAGVPECWGTIEPTPIRRAVRIVANLDASGGISNDTLFKRGAAVSALVILLQTRGHPVTVDVLCPDGTYSKRGCFVRIASAESGSILDIDKVTFALAHPGFLRVFFRGWTNEFIGGAIGRWDTTGPLTNEFPEGEIDLVLGGTHYDEVDRYRDGGEQWIVQEYLRQTEEG